MRCVPLDKLGLRASRVAVVVALAGVRRRRRARRPRQKAAAEGDGRAAKPKVVPGRAAHRAARPDGRVAEAVARSR